MSTSKRIGPVAAIFSVSQLDTLWGGGELWNVRPGINSLLSRENQGHPKRCWPETGKGYQGDTSTPNWTM